MIKAKQQKQKIGPRFLIKLVEVYPIISKQELQTESSNVSGSQSKMNELIYSMSKNQKLETSRIKLQNNARLAGVLIFIKGK
ncbi:UNKNOWN [Stylonychia lemnae]|uniref:Uncharacterized protein n=1 Tax=Stylonychia lemnae TaxID=5949 RepID=A0A078A5K3_STYLE|nr:UNKNOWN [Stylonychia lemnae]|eukprot:CDW77515.1 UNKNOWN [Stylonychia lemnae]